MISILLVGPPGSGKVSRARQIARAWCGEAAPFRAPHHTVSELGLVGSARLDADASALLLRQGEASLASGGTLLLDEVTEFRRSALDSLAHALRAGYAHHAWRGVAASQETRPALLVLASNLCACGYLGSSHSRVCVCSPASLARWTARLVEYCDVLGVTEIRAVSLVTTASLCEK